MSNEEFIKEKTEELVNKYKNGFKLQGVDMGERDELFFRNGIASGIQIASLALLNIKCNDILKVNK